MSEVTSRLLRTLSAVLLTMLLVAPTAPARAAGSDGLSVTITGLSPTTLGDDGTLRLTGQVTNDGGDPWTAVQAYLLIRPTPFTNAADLQREAEIDLGFTGTRIIEPGRFDELGSLAADESKPFTLSMPVGALPITRSTGVYPVGVQILATDAEGNRSTEAVARATTFVPLMPRDADAARTTVVWPLLMPSTRRPDGEFTDPDGLLAAMAPGGFLRNRLDLILATDGGGRGVIVDPALVRAAADLVDVVDDDDQAIVEAFRDDVVALGSGPSAWVLDYDRTDVLALASDENRRRRLTSVVERATDAVTREFELSRNRVSWPTTGGVTPRLLTSVRERGDAPVIVSAQAASDWSTSDGALLDWPTSGGDVPLLLHDDLARQLPGDTTTTTLRQRIWASAALASLEGGAAESVVLVDPQFDPGPLADDPLASPPRYLDPQPLSSITPNGSYSGSLPSEPANPPLSAEQVAAADGAAQVAGSLASASIDDRDRENAFAAAIASSIGVRWRSDPEAGREAAAAVESRLRSVMDTIVVMGPEEVTLSSEVGPFPVTISNGSDSTIRVGVRLDSSNPALDLPDQPAVEVAAGERRTVNVEVDLAGQNATTVTAYLTAPDGTVFGASEEFIVRSSQVGTMLWALMGGAGLLVVFALLRRFRRSRGTPSSPAGDLDE